MTATRIHRQYGDDEIRGLEEKLGRPLASLSLREVVQGRAISISRETVSVSSSLVQDKVAQLVLDGAGFNGRIWREIVNVVDMSGSEKMEVPTITENDFKVRTGATGGAGKISSGGQYGVVSLDVTKESKDRYMYVAFKKRDIELKKWEIIENGLRAAGAAFAKKILDEVVEAYDNDAGVSEALGGNNRFTALTNLIGSMMANGFNPNACVMHPQDYTEVLQTQMGTGGPAPFISAIHVDRDGESMSPFQGRVGRLFGYIPTYLAVNSTLLGEIILVEREKGKVLGLNKDITVEDFNDPIKSLEGFVLTSRYDLVTGFANAIGKVTGV